MSKKNKKIFSWNVKRYEFNKKTIEDFDVIPYICVYISKLKRQKVDKDTFAKKLFGEMKFRFWCKCEFELQLKITEYDRIILTVWNGSENAKEPEIDVTDNIDFDWYGFAKMFKDRYDKNDFRIDVWDQLSYRWDDFVTCCWEYK